MGEPRPESSYDTRYPRVGPCRKSTTAALGRHSAYSGVTSTLGGDDAGKTPQSHPANRRTAKRQGGLPLPITRQDPTSPGTPRAPSL